MIVVLETFFWSTSFLHKLCLQSEDKKKKLKLNTNTNLNNKMSLYWNDRKVRYI